MFCHMQVDDIALQIYSSQIGTPNSASQLTAADRRFIGLHMVANILQKRSLQSVVLVLHSIS